MIIRASDVQDWESLKSIRLQALSDSPTAFGVSYADAANYTEQRWKALASAQKTPYFWLAIDRDMPVGMIGGGIDQQQRFTLIGMWVTCAHRRSGIANRLVETLKRRALELGFDRIVLGVSPDNLPAVNVYKRQGFAFIDETGYLSSHPSIKVQTMEWLSATRNADESTPREAP